jgi:hypothetical protein
VTDVRSYGRARDVVRKMTFREGIVRRDDEAEVSLPSLEEFSDEIQAPPGGKALRVRLTAESRDKMRKRALVSIDLPGFSPFVMWCDEGASLGGEDSAPGPLAYFSAAIAF